MVYHLSLTAAFYAFPLSLYITRLLLPLLLPRPSQFLYRESKATRTLNLIWYLQLIVSLLLLATTISAAAPYVEAIRAGEGVKLAEAKLISYATISLYFTAGLLPDPDGPFEPTASHAIAWIVSVVFEIALTIVAVWMPSQSRTTQVVLGGLRAGFLLAMIVSFFVITWQADRHHNDPEVHRSLLNSEQDYGTVDLPSALVKKQTPQRRKGWLDYFIGFRILFPYIWPSNMPKEQLVFLVSLILLIGQRVVNILVPWQLEMLVESLGGGKIPYKNIATYVICRGLQGQQGILGSFRAILWIPVSQSLFRRLTCAAFEHILGLSLDFHLSKRLGEVVSALNKGSALNTFLDGFAFQLFPMVFDLGVAAVYFLIRVDAFYSLIIIGVMWSYIYMTIYMAKWRAKARRDMTNKDREMDAAKMDTLMSYETVHHNDAVMLEVDRFGTHVAAYQKSEFLVLFSLNFLNITQNIVLTLGVLLVVLISALEISVGMHTVAMFVGILGYFTQLQAPLQFFGSFYNQVQTNLVEAERMLDLFKQKSTVVDRPDAKDVQKCSGLIRFHNVSFAYDSRQQALKNLSFTVLPGTKTAIVGESGSGKSTCLKLLYRFHDVTEGAVEIDGEDVRELKLRSFRKHIGVVPQDTILFNMSIMYNLQYARPDATAEEIFQACRAASIHDKILGFPDGYDTMVGERGLRLSGGEKQRIAIARAILKAPQIILLDEATASLDSQTEQNIQGALELVTRGRTTLTIAHRLSTITRSDQIIVLHQGEIVERGTHEELLGLDGRYSKMWEKQTNVDRVTIGDD